MFSIMEEFPFKFEDGKEFYTKVQPGNWVLMQPFKKVLPEMYNFELRPDDVWLIGPMKSGNTWASEMVWTVHQEGNLEGAEESHFSRWCFPEFEAYAEGTRQAHKMLNKESKIPDILNKNHIKATKEFPSPRFIRSHLPLSLLPPKLLDTCKVIFIARNPKDTVVSFYHMSKSGLKPPKDFQEIFNGMVSDELLFSPWLAMIKEAWEHRHHKNMQFIFFEDMKKDLEEVLQKTSMFLKGKTLSEDKVEKLKHHLSLETMKKNKNISMDEFKQMGVMGRDSEFIRKGKVGEHKSLFTEEMEQKVEEWWKKHMSDCDLKFPVL